MAFLAKIGVSIGLLLSSILGIFHHGQNQVSITATSTSQTAQLASSTSSTTILDANGKETWYSKDATHVYFANQVVQGADPITFVVFSDALGKNIVMGLAKDDKHIYFNDQIVAGADLTSFVSLGDGTEYAKDKNYVYYIGSEPIDSILIIPGADPVTFQIVSIPTTYDAQDKNHKYLQGQIVQINATVPWVPVAKSNGFYFEQDGKIYVKTPAFGDTTEITGADPATFVVPDPTMAGNLEYSYVKDKSHVWYRTMIDGSLSIVQGADVESFIEVTGQDFEAQDKNHKYLAGAVLCEDPTQKTCSYWDGPGGGYGHWFQNNP